MTSQDKPSEFRQAVDFLSGLQNHRQAGLPEERGELDAQMALLRAWQSERLSRTHADLLRSPRYGPACRFFASDIYAAQDFSQRDHDLIYVYQGMSHFLPDFLLTAARKLIELNELTGALDQALLGALVNNLGITDTITPELYAEAYRMCDNYVERVRQLSLTVEVGEHMDTITHIPLIGTTLRLARVPAVRAGWGDLQDFFERGYAAFRRMHGAKAFLETIERRERLILDQIFASDPVPFDI